MLLRKATMCVSQSYALYYSLVCIRCLIQPYFSKYTLEELLDIERKFDKNVFPEIMK